MKDEFPLTPVLARAWDRGRAIALIKAGVDWQLREVFESALAAGREALRRLGEDEATIAGIEEAFRRRDAERLDMQMTGDITAGRQLLIPNWVGDRAPAAPAVAAPSPSATD